MAQLLAAVEEGNRALEQRVKVLEQRAAERKRTQPVVHPFSGPIGWPIDSDYEPAP
jgi:hypothetical protein